MPRMAPPPFRQRNLRRRKGRLARSGTVLVSTVFVGRNRGLLVRHRVLAVSRESHGRAFFAAGVRARRFFERLACESEKRLEEQMCDFDALGIREVRNAAASAARKADVIAVSVSAQQELPGTVRAWFDMWLWLLEDENPALVALFDSHATPKLVSIRDYLSCIAQRAGIE